jgi:hypothetical protein
LSKRNGMGAALIDYRPPILAASVARTKSRARDFRASSTI